MLIEAWLTLAVILVALVLFVTEAVTVDLAALVVMALLIVLGLVTPTEGISGFAHPATITILVLFILSAGIERTGLVNLLAHRMSGVAGTSHTWLLVLLVAVVVPVSAFLNNTAVVAIMIPLAVELSRDKGLAPSKVLIPLSFASMLGGMMTLIGTSTNIIASNVAQEMGYGTFGMFEFTLPGLVIAAVGLLYLLTIGRWFTPDRGLERVERYQVRKYLGEVTVPEDSPFVGRMVGELNLPDRYGVEVVLITRDGVAVDVDARTEVAPGDILLLLGTREDILEVASLERLAFRWQEVGPSYPQEDVTFYEALVTPNSRLVGRTVQASNFRERYGGTVVAVRKGARVLQTATPIARAHLDVGDALLIAGTPEDRASLESYNDLLLVEEVGGRRYRREKAPLAIGVLAFVMAGAALLPELPGIPTVVGANAILVTGLVGAIALPVLGVLDMEEFHRAIRWDILFLLAGLFPLGIAMQNSHLAGDLANLIVHAGGSLPPLYVLMVVYALTVILTSLISNNAAVILVAPIAANTAVALGLDPRTFILAAMFAASASFLTPIGYQTNTMIYGPGGYRFTDYARVGLPLTLIFIVLVPYVLLWFFPA